MGEWILEKIAECAGNVVSVVVQAWLHNKKLSARFQLNFLCLNTTATRQTIALKKRAKS